MQIGQKRKSYETIIHYSTTFPLTVVCDTYLYRISAILSQKYPDIPDGPIAQASRSL